MVDSKVKRVKIASEIVESTSESSSEAEGHELGQEFEFESSDSDDHGSSSGDMSDFTEIEDLEGLEDDCFIVEEPEIINAGINTSVELEETDELFSGSTVSSKDCSIALLSIMHKHCLTYSAVTDIIKLFSNSLPSPNSLSGLMQNYVDYDADTIVHRCCGYCTQLLPDDSSCPLEECKRACIPDSSFVEVCLEKQLKTFFSGNYSR